MPLRIPSRNPHGLPRFTRLIDGASHFFVNSSGNISVRPHGKSTLPHHEIDLLKIVKEAVDPKSSGGLGLQLPLIVRLPDVLKNRLESLNSPLTLSSNMQSNLRAMSLIFKAFTQ